jgi:hypothetical protein
MNLFLKSFFYCHLAKNNEQLPLRVRFLNLNVSCRFTRLFTVVNAKNSGERRVKRCGLLNLPPRERESSEHHNVIVSTQSIWHTPREERLIAFDIPTQHGR